MGTVYYGPGTEADLNDIWEYIAQDSPSAADNLMRSFDARFRRLADHPLIGRVRYDLDPRLRSWPAGNYVIFYRPVADGIEVVMVVHGSRDIGTVLLERLRQRFDHEGEPP